jgi:ferredoxin-thioredoxin reductase catalytic chain
MKVEDLYHRLRAINESKGYFFNRDHQLTMSLLDALLKNRQRYGYMCCPCRLSKEDVKADKDIICPCAYREEDVRQFGSCYCKLYVSEQWNQGLVPDVYVPERRPEELC